jgi:hypothetical protein
MRHIDSVEETVKNLSLGNSEAIRSNRSPSLADNVAAEQLRGRLCKTLSMVQDQGRRGRSEVKHVTKKEYLASTYVYLRLTQC